MPDVTALLAVLAPGPTGWGDELLEGAAVTVTLAAATLPFGLALGLLVALMRRSSSRLARTLGELHATVYRGLPELLTLLIVYYGGQRLLTAAARLVVPDAEPQVSAFVAGVVALGLVFSAYASEVFLSAFRGFPPGQTEAARALGLGRVATFRFVVAPQLLRLALPGLGNLWLVLLKDTALVSVIALPDLMRLTNVAVLATKEPFLFYGAACALYLVLSGLSTLAIGRLDRALKRGEAGRPA